MIRVKVKVIAGPWEETSIEGFAKSNDESKVVA